MFIANKTGLKVCSVIKPQLLKEASFSITATVTVFHSFPHTDDHQIKAVNNDWYIWIQSKLR